MSDNKPLKVWIVRDGERVIGAGLSYTRALAEARDNSFMGYSREERLSNGVENGANVVVIQGGFSIAHETLPTPTGGPRP